jgi:hypothetical protein
MDQCGYWPKPEPIAASTVPDDIVAETITPAPEAGEESTAFDLTEAEEFLAEEKENGKD